MHRRIFPSQSQRYESWSRAKSDCLFKMYSCYSACLVLPWPNEHSRQSAQTSYVIAKRNAHTSANIFQSGQSVKADMCPSSRAKHKKCMDPWICKGFSEDVRMLVFALPADENANLHSPVKTNFIKRGVQVMRQRSFRWQSAAVKNLHCLLFTSRPNWDKMICHLWCGSILWLEHIQWQVCRWHLQSTAELWFSQARSQQSKTKGSPCRQLRWHFFLYIRLTAKVQ